MYNYLFYVSYYGDSVSSSLTAFSLEKHISLFSELYIF